MHGFGVDAMLDQIIMHKLVETGGDTLAFDVFKRADRGIIRGRETECRCAEAKFHVLFGVRSGVEQQIMAGDADVDGTASNVDGDIEWTQIEQLHVIVGILYDQLTRIAPQTIASFGQHVPGRFRQHAFVRHGNSQHFSSPKRPCLLRHGQKLTDSCRCLRV